jgi:Amt family ammonium transporter
MSLKSKFASGLTACRRTGRRFAVPALAQDAAAAGIRSPPRKPHYIFNTLLFLIGGFLVMWMAAGFAMLEAGMVRSKNVSMQCLKNIALYSIAGIMFWVIGYNLMYTGRERRLFRHVRPYAGLIRWAATRRLPAIRPPTGSSRWCSVPPPPRSSRARSPSASSCGRS